MGWDAWSPSRHSSYSGYARSQDSLRVANPFAREGTGIANPFARQDGISAANLFARQDSISTANLFTRQDSLPLIDQLATSHTSTSYPPAAARAFSLPSRLDQRVSSETERALRTFNYHTVVPLPAC